MDTVRIQQYSSSEKVPRTVTAKQQWERLKLIRDAVQEALSVTSIQVEIADGDLESVRDHLNNALTDIFNLASSWREYDAENKEEHE